MGQELYERIAPLQKGTFLKHVIIAAYCDYISLEFDLEIPEEVRLSRIAFL
ncbi:MAG TPA: hypothetical protein VN456_17700 [Desulfosporosinus sp.]|nr:hypothetical protein [Desulfosporosinus sp.]